MKRELFEIWEEPTTAGLPQTTPTPWASLLSMPWRVQLVNYAGNFPTRGRAESFVETTKMLRAQAEKSVTKSK